ncbi:hypothetical protein [Helicobacter trogontum]|uniref:hypothetical protein n=1 Tax=Helicobacter trogontum TaxID=50960 RepID=UPI002A918AA4|nr:hypothetical protein [Helicobacter trogontum]MDY5184400.1 hypothetical protein [Helicobacter trogontum]
MSYKKFCLGIVLLPIPFIMFCGTMLYFYDAGQVWHKPYFRDTKFFELRVHSRMQNKALIDFYDFDSIIMGSSMMFGMSYKEAEEKLGGQWVNMSMSGSSMHDKAIVINYALKKKQIKRVIMSLDWIERVHNSNTDSFKYLYDDKWLNNMKLYLDLNFISCALIWSNSKTCIGDKDSYQQIMRPNDISLDKAKGEIQWLKNNRNDTLDSKILESVRRTWKAESKHIDMKPHISYLENNIFSFVRENPNTTFYFIMPTATRLIYRITPASEFYIWRKVMAYFVAESAKYANIKIYGFDDLSYADNLGNYIDGTHYHTSLSSMQLNSIKNSTHMLTADNIETYLNTMEQQIKDYDLQPIVEIMQEQDRMKQ